jgi:hypothetical protein
LGLVNDIHRPGGDLVRRCQGERFAAFVDGAARAASSESPLCASVAQLAAYG